MESRGKSAVEAEIAELEGRLRGLRQELAALKRKERWADPKARALHSVRVRRAVLAKSPRTLPPMTKQQRGKYHYLMTYMSRVEALAIVVPYA